MSLGRSVSAFTSLNNCDISGTARKPVVANGFTIPFGLVSGNGADDAAVHTAAGKAFYFRDNDDVQRVAISAFSAGYKTKVERKHEAGGQYFIKLEETQVFIPIIFLGTAFWRFYNGGDGGHEERFGERLQKEGLRSYETEARTAIGFCCVAILYG